MTKEQEILHLKALKGSTYFSDAITDEGIDQMISNVRNDFNIFTGMEFFKQKNVGYGQNKKFKSFQSINREIREHY